MFGAYSNRILVNTQQIRHCPNNISLENIAGVPAVAATALHCINLANTWKNLNQYAILSENKACLIHSAAGGVGSMLIQMCKIIGYNPIVAVVGSSHKIAYCVDLGADYVIDKSKQNLWKEVENISPNGYFSIFDANGIETINNSYNHLCQNGKLIIYGFHTNLPIGSDLLSPLSWIKMAYRLFSMPKFDPMELVLTSKAICGFNLSFFANEKLLIETYMTQIVDWITNKKILPSKVTCYPLSDIRKAHALIQSGKSIGKIVIKMN